MKRRKKGSQSDRAAWIMRLVWYGCATILVLTLPIFSDWSGPPAVQRDTDSEQLNESLVQDRQANPIVVSDSRGRIGQARVPAVRPGSRGVTSARVDAARKRSRDEQLQGNLEALSRRETPPLRQARAAAASLPRPGLTPGAVTRNSASLSRRPPPAPAWGGAAGTLQQDLEEIERGYDQAYNTLFPELAGVTNTGATSNPFDDALNQDPAGDPGSGEPPPQPDSGGDGTDPPADPDAGGDTPAPDPDPGNEPAPPEPQPEPEPPVSPVSPPAAFNFLVVGDFPEKAPLISRANLVGSSFVLENTFEVEFFPGALPALIGFSNDEKVMTTDFNQDGLTDFVASRVEPAIGSVIESYLQIAPGRFQLHGSTVLFLQEVNSFAFFDLTGDGLDELVLVVGDSDRLFVYELIGQEWTYLRELVLPFPPGFVLSSSAGAPLGTRLLYVVDQNLEHVVNLSPRQSQSFRFGSRAPLNHLSVTEVDWEGQGNSPVLLVQLQDLLMVAERRGGRIQGIGAFDIRDQVPFIILGDYLGRGSRQLLWVP